MAYNAIHIIQAKGQANFSEWQRAVLETLDQIGLGVPHINPKGTVQFSPLTSLIIATPNTSLNHHIQQELNQPFTIEQCPLRFFIITNAQSYYFGVTYNHWIADAYSMRKVLQQIVARYQNNPLPQNLSLHTQSFRTLFRHHLGWLPSTLWLREMLRGIQLFYRAHRLSLTDKKNFHSHHVLQTLSEDVLQKLTTYCKQKNTTLNNIFLSILAQVMGKISAPARYQNRRNRIAISTIADIRHAANQSLDCVVGQYLSSYTVVLDAPEQQPISTIIDTISQSTSLIKNSSRMVRSHYNFETAVRLWDRNPKRRTQLFYKYAPICAGISNVNVREEWNNSFILDYWRVSPTGPLTPAVFSLTTFRGKLTACLAYRRSAFSESIATEISELFCQKIDELIT